jgi:hypothetical protein
MALQNSLISRPIEISPTPPLAATPLPSGQQDAGEPQTATLDPAVGPSRNALLLLDHRSRRRAVPAAIALPGHYIGLDDESGDTFLIPLQSELIHVGRAMSADVRFEDPQVSRRHAIIVRYGRHVRVLDDRSLAGTFVNGVRITATDLTDGDVVRLGPVAFTYTVVR